MSKLTQEQRKEIIDSLQQMIKEARKGNLVIFATYPGQYWTPDEFERDINNGQYIWHRVNFELRDPYARRTELWNRARRAMDEYEHWCQRIGEDA